MNNDGDADIVVSADGKLWLYENDSNAAVLPAVMPRVEIGNGGWSPMTITAPGDLDKDGHPDLLVRDTRDGLLYRYNGSAMFGTRTPIGSGYTTTSRPLIAGAADADRDGSADMWTTTGTGTLTFYGNPAGGANTVVGASGWGTITPSADPFPRAPVFPTEGSKQAPPHQRHRWRNRPVEFCSAGRKAVRPSPPP
ncbi:FG-GAP repeat domain-containing protein [Streptomyces sp. NBC_00691]|uniref:FG-GAP repeat domain-containing protein n=1 Tax=Streptomyces sp. NBC_00691 TaxID=2903671 RepID=UPI002E2F56A8|nr:VCBS repeat-containing protein [Streptomyces sp. NBC_00691]